MQLFHQPVDDGLLGDGLAVPDAHQLAADALAGDVDHSVPADVVLPGDGGGKGEQLLEGENLPLVQKQQHTVGGAQVQLGPEGVCHIAQKTGAALLRLGLKAHAAQLVGHHALQPEGRRCKKCMVHGVHS